MSLRNWRGRDWQQQATAITTPATRDPTTRCWRDGLTLAQHQPHPDGKPQSWTAGHVDDLDQARRNGARITYVHGHPVAPECSHGNYSNGASTGNRLRTQGTTRNW